MNKKILVVKLVVVTIIVFYLSLTWLSAHELAHARIFSYYGCENVVIEFDGLQASTTCLDNRTFSADMWFLHGMNEVIGYNFQSLIYALIILIAVIYIKR